MNPARTVSVAILGIAGVGAAHVVVERPAEAVSQTLSSDPLAKALERCLQLGGQAETDRDCQAAYAENRARFFTPPAPYAPGRVELFPNRQTLTIDKTSAQATQEK